MPRLMSVRLWQISKRHTNGPSLRAALEAVRDLGDPGVREAQLTTGIRCRLERLQLDGGTISGEMTRVRHEDYPAEIHPDGTRALNVAVPIGDGVAFRYRQRDHVLAFQYDDRILAAGRFLDYLERVRNGALFDLRPIIDPRKLQAFQDRPLKKVRLRIANPADVVVEEDSQQAAAQSFRRLGEAYNAPTVTIELSVGTGGGVLNAATKRMMQAFLRTTDEDDLRQARAFAANEQGRAEEINLLDMLFSHKEEIESVRDLDDNYAPRQRLLTRVLNAHR